MFELACPWVLLGLIIPLIIWFVIPQARIQVSSALQVPFYQAICSIVSNPRRLNSVSDIRLFFIISSLVLFSAAGPRWVGAPEIQRQEGHNIMLALDLSGSMELNDMLFQGQPVSRLAIVKYAAKHFVQQRVGDRIGLILFGTRAYLQTPLTYDRQSVLLRLTDATVGLAGQTTSIGDALGLSIKRLEQVSPKGRVIILLTDGANNSGILSPLKAAELARSDQIKIYTIGLGGEIDPRLVRQLFLSGNPSTDLDEKTLKKIAQITHGRYFRATDIRSLDQIYRTINKLETIEQEQESIRPQHDYYPWSLALAFLLLLYWFIKKSNLWNNKLIQKLVIVSEVQEEAVAFSNKPDKVTRS